MASPPHRGTAPLNAPDEAFVRMGAVCSVPEVLREFGQDPLPILERVGFKSEFFDNPELKIPFHAMGRLLSECVKASQCPHFGLLVGDRVSANLLGLAGFIMQHANDVGTALHDFIQYLDLHDQGAVVSLSDEFGTSLLEYSIYLEGVESCEQIIDGAMAVGCNIMKCLCGPEWKPVEILFAHKKPADSTPHSKYLKAPLRFNAGRNAVVFSNDWLKARPPRQDPWLYQYLKQQAEQIHKQSSHDFPGKFQPMLRILLLNEKCTLEEASNQLGIHSRTLNRRLKLEGTTFRNEVAKAMYVMATQFLSESSAPVGEIATSLGYTSTSAFAHAFKRWSGMTPSDWRKASSGSL